jgi:HSP20 family molecular chaperone IbpA
MATLTTTTSPRPAARREPGERAARTISPRVDIYETDKAYVLLADMPGVTAEGLDVEAERDTLIVRGRVERPATPPDYQEFELADYQRAFTLTEDLDTEGITAALRDGVLRVEIPKSPQMQPKKIPVRTE